MKLKLTDCQKDAMYEMGLCVVNYRDMWKAKKQLGYSSKGTTKYEINIASDFPDRLSMDIILLHEIGHVYYGHLDRVDLKKEFSSIKKICNELGLPFSVVSCYGGPHKFVNIAMDCYINSTLLTEDNVSILEKKGITPCTPKYFSIDKKKDFRDYYKPLIEKAEENKDKKDKKGFDTMNDLSDSVSAFDSDLDSDVAEEIMKEGYSCGTSKSFDKNIVKKSTVSSELDRILDENRTDSGSYSPNGSSSSIIQVVKNNEENIKKFLESIVSIKRKPTVDIMKHFNRGTRRSSSGILYESKKQVINKKKKRLGILIDVSGSMNAESITRAISSIDKSNISSDSVVVTWSTSLEEEFPINKVPTRVKKGGGTEISSGVQYLKEKGIREIVIYSDFETDISSLKDSCKNVSVYAILVGNSFHNVEGLQFVKNCKKNINVL